MSSRRIVRKTIGLAMIELLVIGRGAAQVEPTDIPLPPTATAVPTDTPLPANPDGLARLQTLIQALATPPQAIPQPVPPPAIAEQVWGETYILESNEFGLASFSLVRQAEAEAQLRLTWDETA